MRECQPRTHVPGYDCPALRASDNSGQNQAASAQDDKSKQMRAPPRRERQNASDNSSFPTHSKPANVWGTSVSFPFRRTGSS